MSCFWWRSIYHVIILEWPVLDSVTENDTNKEMASPV